MGRAAKITQHTRQPFGFWVRLRAAEEGLTLEGRTVPLTPGSHDAAEVRHHIAIAGCGPAGLATALLLHRDGHHVTLFERFDAPRPVRSGLMIQPTGLAVLRQLGLADALVFELSKVERVDIRAWAVSHLRNIDEDLAATVAVPDIRTQTWSVARKLSNAHWVGGEGL